MIVYNVDRGWFPMKNDAEGHRKSLGLKPGALTKIDITHRDQLAALLNGLMGLKADEIPGAVLEPQVAEPEVIERNYVEVPDYVPEFLAKHWAEGKPIKWIKSDEDSVSD